VRYSIGIKGFWFKKNFTAQVQEAVPFSHIVWSTTQGNIKNTGRISFIEQGENLTLMILNLDMAPSGLKEKWVRGFRYHKRGVRSDFHRFAAWVQMRTPDQLLDMEGWLGTVEGGKVTESHEEYVEEHEEEQDRAEKAAEEASDAYEDSYMPEDEEQDEEEDEAADEEDQQDAERDGEADEEDEEEGEEDDEYDEDEDDEEDEEVEDDSTDDDEEEEEKPEPPPLKQVAKKRKQSRSKSRGTKSAADKPPVKRKRSTAKR